MTTTCAGCGADVLPTSSFCQRCGRRLACSCASCGYECESDFAFCPRCGTARGAAGPATSAVPPPLAASEPSHEADRRQVTVVFADLTGFTSLAEGLDPETLRTFQNALFAVMAQAIARYDGFVEKFVGDAVMAVFGAPRAHEDDPLRAVEAAQDMLRGVEQLSAQWMARLGRAVTLHIGVHTGAVVAGSLGSGTGGTYAVTGDTVNTASRLLTAAAPGRVLLSEATHAMVRHRFDFEPPAELALRGKAEPMRVHGLIGIRKELASARGLADLGLSAPLVGRGDALGHLLAAFDRMQGGQAQVVSVVGEAGAGKSRLLAELFARLEDDGRFKATGVRRATCSSLGEPTYGTFGALFRDAYRVETGDSLEAARRKLQEGLAALGAGADEADAVAQVLNYLLGIQEARPRDIEPEQLQRQITLAARALIERRLSQQPVMVVVDDLHWADAASVDLLGEVVDQLADRPFMVLAFQRPDARSLRAGRAEQSVIDLSPLGEQDARSLVLHLLGAPADDDLAPLLDFVAARAGGNPLFVEEIVRSLAGRGLLVRKDGLWSCEDPCEGVDVPPTLYGLLLSRIDRLGTDDRRTLQEAAVLGADFDSMLLQRIASEPRSLEASLHRLAAANLVRTSGRGWCFTHALLHEVAYQNLLLSRRTDLHHRAGRALETVLGVDAKAPVEDEARSPLRLADLEALARHWSLSPDKAHGAHYLVAAGDWARAVYANDDAVRHYERALRTLAGSTADTPAAKAEVEAAELDARERIADLFGLQGRRSDALAQYEIVQRADERQVDPIRTARVLRKTGGLHWEAGERERAGACFTAGLERLGENGDPIERAHLFQEMGRLAFRAGDNDRALALAQRALAEVPAEPAGRAREASVVRAEACNTLGVALARLGRPAEAVEHVENSVAQAEANNMLQAACRGYTNLGVLYASLDPQRSIETCLRGLETARKVGDLGFQSRLYANLAVAYCALTNRCEAEGIEAANAAASLDRRLGLLDHLAVPLIVLGQIYQCHGDHARAFASYTEALQLAEQVDEPQLLFPCYDGLATLYLDAGRPAQAETYLAKAQAVCERAGLEPDALMVLPFLC
ncbi:adenylate/guanylate cyclase domain-containing protein [Variovorax sp. J22R24]|uniref:adenylate/guanylate cyclase domain-containing protein n=1 Tax=Variovorax gracilis TaxID=3053502 RepID=UPI0025783A41|nr:adenylate/guanylate cyclase domain-containing protein [Variovorax sp. J22R24]MDM0108264.1 adenylate/guanylate cyclase domain-containing protein [Variovorax sp. J22R24]